MNRDLIPNPGSGELWVGGYPGNFEELLRFDLVVNATVEAVWPQPFGAGLYLRVPLQDSDRELRDPGTALRVRAASAMVAGGLAVGWRVLVHCGMGLNRSGVVAARALMFMGLPWDRAVAAVRENRHARGAFGMGALFNRGFVAWLAEEGGAPGPSGATMLEALGEGAEED